MATYFARKAGNINASDVWATTPSGTAAAVTFASGDVLVANSFAIAINVDTNLGGSGQVRNDTTGGATVGGGFTLNAGVTLTANCFAGSSSTACVTFSSALPSVGYIVGNVTGGTGASNSIGANNSLTGSLYLTGSVTGGSGNSSSFGCQASAGGNVYITGNVTGGLLGEGARATNGSNIFITGNVTGGSGSGYGARNLGTGSIVVTGQAIASATTSAILNGSTGTVSVTRAVGNGYGLGSIGQSLVPAVDSTAQGSITIVQELEWGALGAPPTNGVIRLSPASTNLAKFFTGTGTKTLVDATQGQMPAASNVKSGVSYASGALTGTCAVPAASSVMFGVPVDATTGTAVLDPASVASAVWGAASRTITGGTVDTLTNAPASVTPSDIWSHATRTITGGTVDTLTNAPTVPSASAIASQVRTELATELGRVDQNISSRLAAADYTAPSAAPTVTAIRQEMDSNSTKLANLDATVSSRLASSAYTAPTTPPTAAEIATAVEGSLLNEADGQAVLNAIVSAIGNTNLSEVSLVAAVRADLERNGGKLDSIPTTSAPSASTVAGAVRTELGTELGRIDAAVSTRLASASYTAPANSDITAIKAKTDNLPASPAATGDIPSANITAIKAKTDLLNTDRLANVATTNIVGTLLAQANS